MSNVSSAVSLSFSFLYLMFYIPRILLASGRHSEHGSTRGDVQYLQPTGPEACCVIFERMTFFLQPRSPSLCFPRCSSLCLRFLIILSSPSLIVCLCIPLFLTLLVSSVSFSFCLCNKMTFLSGPVLQRHQLN